MAPLAAAKVVVSLNLLLLLATVLVVVQQQPTPGLLGAPSGYPSPGCTLFNHL